MKHGTQDRGVVGRKPATEEGAPNEESEYPVLEPALPLTSWAHH